jgi:CRISPR/Cas system-associated endonuclease Cas1
VKGFYHTGRHGRPSLALDLTEEFRPVIADSVVLTLINNSMLTLDPKRLRQVAKIWAWFKSRVSRATCQGRLSLRGRSI